MWYLNQFARSNRRARSTGVCDEWKDEDQRRDIDLLYSPDAEGRVVVHDSRELPTKEYTLTESEAALLRVAERPRSAASLRSELSGYSQEIFDASLNNVRALRLVFEDGDLVVSLALPRSEVAPRRHSWDNYGTRWRRRNAVSVVGSGAGAVTP